MRLPSEFAVSITLVLTVAVMLAVALAGIALNAWRHDETVSAVLFTCGAGLVSYTGLSILWIVMRR